MRQYTITKNMKNPKICFKFIQRTKEYCLKYTNTQDVKSNFCISHMVIQLQIKTEDCFLPLLWFPVTYHHGFWPELSVFGMVTGGNIQSCANMLCNILSEEDNFWNNEFFHCKSEMAQRHLIFQLMEMTKVSTSDWTR